MANRDAPKGLHPVRHLTGGIIRPKAYKIASGYNTSIWNGDPVKLVADGTIERAAVGDRVIGTFHGVDYAAQDGSPIWARKWTANTVTSGALPATAYVYDDPDLIFSVQSSGATAETDRGQLANFNATVGDDLTGQSRVELDQGTQGAVAAQARILGKIERADNAWGANVELEVQLFEHELAYHGQTTPGGEEG